MARPIERAVGGKLCDEKIMRVDHVARLAGESAGGRAGQIDLPARDRDAAALLG